MRRTTRMFPTLAPTLALLALTLTPVIPASAAEEGADLHLAMHELRHPAALQSALVDYGLDVEVRHLADGHADAWRTPLARFMTKEERSDMPRGVTHVHEFTWDSGTCPLGDGLDLLITGVEDGHVSVPGFIVDLIVQDGDVVLIPQPHEGDPKALVLVVAGPQDAACFSA